MIDPSEEILERIGGPHPYRAFAGRAALCFALGLAFGIVGHTIITNVLAGCFVGCGLGEIAGIVIMARARYYERRRDEAFVAMAYWQMRHDAALSRLSGDPEIVAALLDPAGLVEKRASRLRRMLKNVTSR